MLGAHGDGSASERFRISLAKLWVARYLNKRKNPRDQYQLNPKKAGF